MTGGLECASMRSHRSLTALVALLLAVALAAPLPAARCKTASGGGCPLMKGAAGSLCHRAGAMAAPMDCCKSKSAPASSADFQLQPAPAALPTLAVDLAAETSAPRPAGAAAARDRAAASLHALGLFTLLAVFRN